MFCGVTCIWDHPWRVGRHTMSGQANDSTQSPHHSMQRPQSEKARRRCSPYGMLDLSGVQSHTAVC